jgi:type IX secretion system PorP/SprF family membrane protein
MIFDMQKNTILKGNIILIFLFLGSFNLKAQDIHFSQFHKNPLVINPANTGFYNGNHRAGISYKTQWSSISVPYKTYAAFYDALVLRDKWKKDKFGAGIVFISDKAGDTKMGLFKALVSLSYTKLLTEQNAYLFGIQGGYAQQSVNLSNSTWDEQFNGRIYDPNLPSNELQYDASFSYVDINSGVGWVYRPGGNFQSSTGVSLHHINQPKVQYSSTPQSGLYRKIVVHNTTEIYANNENRSFEPGFIFTKQGPHKEIIAGGMVRLKLREKSLYTGLVDETSFSFGAYYRFADALIFATRLNYRNLELNLTYDFNVSRAIKITNSRGGLELSLIYIYPSKNSTTNKGVPKFF